MSLPVHEARGEVGEILEAALKVGPQALTLDGVEKAVVVSIEEWQRLRTNGNALTSERRSLKDVLLDPNGPHDLILPSRGKLNPFINP